MTAMRMASCMERSDKPPARRPSIAGQVGSLPYKFHASHTFPNPQSRAGLALQAFEDYSSRAVSTMKSETAAVDKSISHLLLPAALDGPMLDITVYYCWSCDAHRKAASGADGKVRCPGCQRELTADACVPIRPHAAHRPVAGPRIAWPAPIRPRLAASA
jgi:hypothetical protein